MVITIRTPRESFSTTDASTALAHFRRAQEGGQAPTATKIGGTPLLDKEMERYASLLSDVYRSGSHKPRR